MCIYICAGLKYAGFLQVKRGEGRPFYWCKGSRRLGSIGGYDRLMCVRGMSRFDADADVEAMKAMSAQEAFVEMDTAWSQPFEVHQPGNFSVKLGTPLAFLESQRQPRPHRLRVVCTT